MSAGSLLLLNPEIFLVVGVVTWSLGGHLTGCFDFSHGTTCLYMKMCLCFVITETMFSLKS